MNFFTKTIKDAQPQIKPLAPSLLELPLPNVGFEWTDIGATFNDFQQAKRVMKLMEQQSDRVFAIEERISSWDRHHLFSICAETSVSLREQKELAARSARESMLADELVNRLNEREGAK